MEISKNLFVWVIQNLNRSLGPRAKSYNEELLSDAQKLRRGILELYQAMGEIIKPDERTSTATTTQLPVNEKAFQPTHLKASTNSSSTNLTQDTNYDKRVEISNVFCTNSSSSGYLAIPNMILQEFANKRIINQLIKHTRIPYPIELEPVFGIREKDTEETISIITDTNDFNRSSLVEEEQELFYVKRPRVNQSIAVPNEVYHILKPFFPAMREILTNFEKYKPLFQQLSVEELKTFADIVELSQTILPEMFRVSDETSYVTAVDSSYFIPEYCRKLAREKEVQRIESN